LVLFSWKNYLPLLPDFFSYTDWKIGQAVDYHIASYKQKESLNFKHLLIGSKLKLFKNETVWIGDLLTTLYS
jgi:hypothetical protein